MSDIDNSFNHGHETSHANRQAEIRLPEWKEKLGWKDVMCLVLNRTIGSGIFVTPTFVLKGTGNAGAALLLWAAGAALSTCGLLVWLEFGLTIPRHRVPGSTELKSVPRSGGEKNYLEWALKKPRFLATCMYGIVFIILGNLSGNAIAFGTYVMRAAGHSDPSKKSVIPIAIGALTLAVLIHVFSRRGAIKLNNYFAVLKVLFLLGIIILGFMNAGGVNLRHRSNDEKINFNTTLSSLEFLPHEWHKNFEIRSSFQMPQIAGILGTPRNPASYIYSFTYILYTFSGFEQPFYVLAEVRKPRKTFPWSTLTAMLIASVLFILVNIAYLCVVPAEAQLRLTDDMATLFFRGIFGHEKLAAQQAMYSLIAMCIFSNILVMTFTASRVKQEIAKEGILPWSLNIADGYQTLDAWLRTKIRAFTTDSRHEPLSVDGEQSPMAALFLHWLSSLVLIAITCFLSPKLSYALLTGLYSYVIIIYMGFWVSLSLLIMRFRDPEWKIYAGFQPWLAPLPAFAYCVGCLFLLTTAFWPPSEGSPFTYAISRYEWYLVPAIGLSAILWGFIWWLGLWLIMIIKGNKLEVRREPLPVQDDEDEDQWVLKSEIISQEWHTGVNWRQKYGEHDPDWEI